MNSKKRIAWIDVAKGICILSVIAGHMGVDIINRTVFSYHLTTFFLLTGYTLKNNFSVEETRKRFCSLMIPYFFTCFAVMAMDCLNVLITNHGVSLTEITGIIARDLLRGYMGSGTFTKFGAVEIGSRIGAIWFLPANFFAVLFVQLLLKYVPSTKKRYALAILLAVVGSMSASFVWLPFSLQSALFAAPVVMFGYDARRMDVFNGLAPSRVLICLLILAVGIIFNVSSISYDRATLPDWILSPICGFVSSLCVVFLSQKLENCKLLSWIGRNSIYFLCLHLFEMNTLSAWFWKLFAFLNIPHNVLTLFLAKVLFISLCTFLLLKWKDHRINRSNSNVVRSDRDNALDMAKAILIVLMILGHFTVDATFRKIIYSFHMAAFVFYSGYCFKQKQDIRISCAIGKQAQHFLIPYALFGLMYLLLTHDGNWIEAKRVLLGISFTQKLFVDTASIGPVYFILLLFCTKCIYLFIEKYVPDIKRKALVVLTLSLLGVCLGKFGYWLPWSFDCALYALIFYFLGYCFKCYGIMDYIASHNYSYFLLSSIWAYMIYAGGMEIAIRNYGSYGLAVLGAVSGSVLLYMLCRYLCNILPGTIIHLLCCVGKSTMYILIVHKLFSKRMGAVLSLRWAESSAVYSTASLLMQLLFGVLLSLLIGRMQVLFRRVPQNSHN